MTQAETNNTPARARRLTWVLTLIIVVPLAFVWGLVVYFDFSQARAQAQTQNMMSAQLAARLVEKTLTDTFRSLKSHEPQLVNALMQDDAAKRNREIKEILLGSPVISGLALYEPNGKGIVHLLPPGKMNHKSMFCSMAPDMDWSNEPWYEEYISGNRRPIVSNAFAPPCAPEVPNAAAVMSLRHEGRMIAALRASFDVASIKNWFGKLRLPEGVQITMVDGEENILYDSQFSDNVRPAAFAREQEQILSTPFFQEMKTRKQFDGIFKSKSSGEKEIAAFMPVSGRSWGVLARRPLSMVDAPVKSHIWRFSSALSVVLLFGMAIVLRARKYYVREIDLSQELTASLDKEHSNRAELADAVEDLTLMNELTAEISTGLEIDELLERVTQSTSKLLRTDASLCLLREAGGSQAAVTPHHLTEEVAGDVAARCRVTSKVLVSGEPVVIQNYVDNEDALQSLIDAGIRSAIYAPIFFAQRGLGVLCALSRSEAPREFSMRDVSLIEAVARQTGIALENSRQFNAQRNVADILQASLLTVPDELESLSIGHLYRSATETAKVGGDFYDIFELSEGLIGLVIGDVSGKGIEAAELTASVKNIIKAYAFEEFSPARVMGKANDAILKLDRSPIFVSAFFSILDRETGMLHYANAGHPPAIVMRDESEITLIEAPSLPLGVLPDLVYEEQNIGLAPGDTLLLYTDGVVETPGKQGMFGLDRLVECLKGFKGQTSEVPSALLDALLQFSENTLNDDIAILSVKFCGNPETLAAPARQPARG